MSTSTTSSNVYYCWVTTWNTTPGSATDVGVYLSHEITEALTDPNANISQGGWVTTTFCPGSPPCELCDQCQATAGVGNYTTLTGGVNCWSSSCYSNKGGGCVIPGILASNNTATTTFTYGGGTVLNNCTIALLFWGPAWTFTNTSTPTLGTADEIKRNLQTLITNTAYFNCLSEYNVGRPTFTYAAINSGTPPTTFQESDVQNAIATSINSGALPNPQANSGNPILYVVVMPSASTYTVGAQVGNHGRFNFITAPPNSVPTTNPPGSGISGTPAPSPVNQADTFGVTELYTTKSGGSTWTLPSNPNSDTRHVFDSTSFTTNSDGSYNNTQTNVAYNIAQNNGFTEASLTLNQATLATQGYMQDSMDWKNVEMTCYFRLHSVANSTHSGQPSITLAMRGGVEQNSTTTLNGFPKSCEGDDYRITIQPMTSNNSFYFSKDLQYTAGITPASKNPTGAWSISGLSSTAWGGWIGLKGVCYNMADGKSVTIEFWADSNGSNTWHKLMSYVDSGNWPAVSNSCGGTTTQQINWGGPVCKFIWNNITSLDIKWASIREIDVYNQNPSIPSPASSSSTTQKPTSSPANNLPPIPPAPNLQPPKTVATGTLDKFGVTEIYPSIAGGQSWYLSNNGLKGDSRVFGIPRSVKEIVNGDGSFRLTKNDSVLFFVSTLAGYSYEATEKDHSVCRARGYMFSPVDWKNVEVTVFHQIDGTLATGAKGLFDFGIKCRTGSHIRQRDCQGCCYEINTRCDVGNEQWRHRKEQWHDAHDGTDRTASYTFTSCQKRWVGEKFIIYNIWDKSNGNVTGIRMEHWWNDSGDGVTWKKVNFTTDIGGWGILDGLCNANPDEKIIWGGPLIAFFWDDFTNVSYKWMSIREIDTSGQTQPPGGPPTPSPPSGPPPKPPAIIPVIGPNAYNVCKFVYSVMVDDSGGCNIGTNPLAHVGQTQIGITVPGTGNTLNMANTSGAAWLAGQKINTTSSLLYNKVLAEYDFSARIVGLPTDSATQLIQATIRRSSDLSITNTFGSISPSLLTSQFQTVVFKAPALSNYTLSNGDIIGVEYYGGDPSNYVQIQTDNSTAFDGTIGTNSGAVDSLFGSTTINNVTGFDIAGSFWSATGLSGVQPTSIYSVNGVPGTSGGVVTGYVPIYSGGITRLAEAPVNSSSGLIGKTIYEIDVFLAKAGSPTGNVSVYLLENTTGLVTYNFGSVDASTLPTGATPKQYDFFNYSNTHINTVNTYIVVEYDGGDSNNYVNVVTTDSASGAPYDGVNTATFAYNGSTWEDLDAARFGGFQPFAFDLSGNTWTSASPPPGTPAPGTGSIGNVTYNVTYDGSFIHFLYGEFWSTNMIGEILNDNQSKLIGTTLSEIDTSLQAIGNPKGNLQWVVFNSAGTAIGFSSSIDASTVSTVIPVNYRFIMNLPSGYTLKAGDKIMLWYQQESDLDPRLNFIKFLANAHDVFDGNHSVLIEFAATGQYPSFGTGGQFNVYLGYSGQWTVYTGQDIAATFYP